MTLFCIILVNFVIINLAPGEPVYNIDVTNAGASRREDQAASGTEERYLQFRQFFGLTLPILYNNWPKTMREQVLQDYQLLETRHEPDGREISQKEYNQLRITTGDRARFVLPHLVSIMTDEAVSLPIRKRALLGFIRGATRFAHIGVNLSEKQLEENESIARLNLFLDTIRLQHLNSPQAIQETSQELAKWYRTNEKELQLPSRWKIFFFETRLCRYLNRTLRLDFGVLRSDPNRTVIVEVISRMKYSLTLAILPMIVT
ncbi:MAG TPA: hypothetical protein VN457_07455, partial [Chlamydiales bacterium]|nr:hypothetical protein [Chlamydiales bacterium]